VSTELLPPYLSNSNHFWWHAHDTVKLNIQFSLCTPKSYMGGIKPFLNLGTTWELMFNFMPYLLYHWEKEP